MKRRTVEPKPPAIEPAVICTSAPALDEPLEARRVALEGGAALRVGEQHAVAAGVEVEHHRLEVADHGRERALDEQVGTAAERQRAQRVVVEVDQAPDRDLPARQHLERDLRRGERRAQLDDARGDQGRVDARVVVDVGGGEDRPRARRDGRPGELERALHRRRTVVDARQDVGVQVDHAWL